MIDTQGLTSLIDDDREWTLTLDPSATYSLSWTFENGETRGMWNTLDKIDGCLRNAMRLADKGRIHNIAVTLDDGTDVTFDMPCMAGAR